MNALQETLPIIIMPLVIVLTAWPMMKNAALFSEFTEGVREGVLSGVRLLPTLIALLTAVSMFRAGGGAAWLSSLLSPLLERLGVPPALAPYLIVRPISGSASSAVLEGLLTDSGADSFAGRCAAVIAGSSDTALYICAVYFGSVGLKKSGAALPCALLTMLFTIFFGCFVARMWFGHA